MKSDVQLREAQPSDTASLDIVRRQAIETGFTDAYERDDFADLVAQPDPNLGDWIEESEKIVLVITSELTPFAYGVYDRENSEILGLFTAENYQDEGHAEKILKKFEASASDHENHQITVYSPHNAVVFFEKLGFEQEEETTHPSHDLSVFQMKKRLD